MKVLMTGASGFVGKRLLTFFENHKDIELTVLSSQKHEKYNYIINNNWSLSRNSIDGKYDCLLLLGGVTPKGNDLELESDYINNIRSVVNIIEALSNLPDRIIYVSSVSVYKSIENEVTEESELQTRSLYGLSKLVSERYLEDICKQRGIELSILRLGQVYGPGEESYNKIVGYFLKKAQKNEPIVIKSDGKEQRNMIFVDDVARTISKLIVCKYNFAMLNVVSAYSISIVELAQLIIKITESKSKIIIQNMCKGRNDLYSNKEISNVFNSLGLTFTTYYDGIQMTYKHFKENHIG